MGAIPGKQGFSRKDSTSQENPPRFHAILEGNSAFLQAWK